MKVIFYMPAGTPEWLRTLVAKVLKGNKIAYEEYEGTFRGHPRPALAVYEGSGPRSPVDQELWPDLFVSGEWGIPQFLSGKLLKKSPKRNLHREDVLAERPSLGDALQAEYGYPD